MKDKLVSTPIMISADGSESFEVICDARVTTFSVVLGKKCNKLFNPIYYASKSFNSSV